MGHAFHFLQRLARVSTAHMERALGLYYSSERTKMVISIALNTNPPQTQEEAEQRIALALDDTERPPYLVANRAGQMITCLAAGMSPYGLRVIDQAHIASACGFYDDMIGRQATLDQIKTDQGDIFRAMRHGAWAMNRSTFRGLSFLWPWLQSDFVAESHESSLHLRTVTKDLARSVRKGLVNRDRADWLSGNVIPALTPSAAKQLAEPLRDYWEHAWRSAHTLLLAFCDKPEIYFERIANIFQEDADRAGESSDGPTFQQYQNYKGSIAWSVIREGCWALSARGLWVIAQCSPHILDSLCEGAISHRTVLGAVNNIYGLAASAIRHPTLKPTIQAALERAAQFHPPYDEIEQFVQGMAFEALELIDLSPDRHAYFRAEMLDFGRGLYERYVHIYEQRLGKRATTPPPAEIPDDVAMTFASLSPLDLQNIHNKYSGFDAFIGLIPWIATANASDFYLPDEYAALFEEEGSNFAIQIVLGHALSTTKKTMFATKPTKAKPGRNDPCFCGSGKKYKVCCLRKS